MLLVLAFLYVFQRVSNSGAAPLSTHFARDTTIDSPLQQPCVCPNVRSIWDIVWSCLVTIFACSWVSVHPNIPKKGLPWWKKFLRRLELMVWSILTPELIISWATRQWMGARRLAKQYHEHGWTKTHGYFIQMGGFVLHDSESKEPIEVLSLELLMKHLNEERIDIPTISEDDILDRSKGDGLAKALVIIQTTWFIIQCIARKAQGLAITQLELATLAFATLNSIMYFLWWNKPLDVESTIPVYLKLPPTEGDKEIEKDKRQVESGVIGGDPGSINKPEMDPQRAASITPPIADANLARKAWWLFSHVLYHWPFAGISAVVTRMGDMLGTETIDDGQTHVKTFYAHVLDAGEGVAGVLMTLVFIGSLFGGIHCVGWHFFFPSLVEANIWRVSSTVITAVPVISLMMIAIGTLGDNYMHLRLLDILFWMIVSLLIPSYILARIALLVEALISLRDLPHDALAVVKWTSFLPHI